MCPMYFVHGPLLNVTTLSSCGIPIYSTVSDVVLCHLQVTNSMFYTVHH